MLLPALVSLTLGDGRVLGRGARLAARRPARPRRDDPDAARQARGGPQPRRGAGARPLGRRHAARPRLRRRLRPALGDGAARPHPRARRGLHGRVPGGAHGHVPLRQRAPTTATRGCGGTSRSAAIGSWDDGAPLDGLAAARVRPRRRRSSSALLQADLDDYPALYLGYRASAPAHTAGRLPAPGAHAKPPGGFQNFDLRSPEGGRHRGDDGHAHVPVARVRLRAAGRRPPRERHGDAARQAARAGRRLLLGEAGQGRLGLLGELEPGGRRLPRRPERRRPSGTTSTSPRATASRT